MELIEISENEMINEDDYGAIYTMLEQFDCLLDVVTGDYYWGED